MTQAVEINILKSTLRKVQNYTGQSHNQNRGVIAVHNRCVKFIKTNNKV